MQEPRLLSLGTEIASVTPSREDLQFQGILLDVFFFFLLLGTCSLIDLGYVLFFLVLGPENLIIFLGHAPLLLRSLLASVTVLPSDPWIG